MGGNLGKPEREYTRVNCLGTNRPRDLLMSGLKDGKETRLVVRIHRVE